MGRMFSKLNSRAHATRRKSPALFVAALLLLTSAPPALARKPKKALKESDAKRAIAATPGFALNRGAVRVKEIPVAGTTPLVVTAEIELALHFEKVETGGGVVRWRAAEFRSGDRIWESFEYLAGPFGAAEVEAARAVLEEMAAEFEAEQRARMEAEKRLRGKEAGEGEKGVDAESAGAGDGKKKDRKKKKKDDKKSKDDEKIEVRRGPLLMSEFSPMYKSARAVVRVEGAFRLEKGQGGKWRVVEYTVGGVSVANPDRVVAEVNVRKATRARADLETVRAALEDFRRERGFYVVAEDETVLIDHLSPRYLKTVIRVDPWSRPYGYEGTREHFTLRSNGPDGLPSTSDDVTLIK